MTHRDLKIAAEKKKYWQDVELWCARILWLIAMVAIGSSIGAMIVFAGWFLITGGR